MQTKSQETTDSFKMIADHANGFKTLRFRKLLLIFLYLCICNFFVVLSCVSVSTTTDLLRT